MCPEICKTAQPGLVSLADDTVRSLSSADMAVPVPVPIVDNSVIKGKFNMNNCADVHFGPKYEHSGDIVIHQNIYNKSKSEVKRLQDNCTKGSLLQHRLSEKLHCCFINCKKVTLISAVAITCIITFTLFLLVYLILNTPLPGDSPNDEINNTPVSPTFKALQKEYPLNKQFVLREAWGAAQPRSDDGLLPLPVERVILIHTVSAGTCNKFSACKQQVLQIQDWLMDNCGDIGYNFVIGSDGYIYVGVGWDRVGCHTRGFNKNSIGVAFVGDFRTDQPNDLMMSSLQRLLDFGVEIKKLSENYQIFGHCQVHSSFPLSPGRNLMKQIQIWPHWNNTYFDRCK